MTRFLSSRRLRWAAPAVVAAAIAAAALTTNVAANASGQPKLSTRTAAQLLAAVEQASPAGLSGTVVETAKLGLPSLPDIGGSGGDDSDLSLQNLITGSHTLRVWEAGSKQQRIALLGQLSESDVVHNGTDLWTYSSTTRKVTHNTLTEPADSGAADHAAGALTPQAAAQQALAAIDPTTTVQVDSTARVAGRAAYQLSLLPKDSRSLIGSVQIAIDSATSVPLRVQVFAKGATSPAIDVGFTDVSFNVPPASIFNFVPPAGTTVTQGKLPFSSDEPSKVTTKAGNAVDRARDGSSSSTKILGTGWTSVAELSGDSSAVPQQRGSNNDDTQLLNQLSTPVTGGRAITTALVSVFITDDGRTFVGPVSVAALQQVAATGKGL
jgi:outer membrane lipoprotein-sorting protein